MSRPLRVGDRVRVMARNRVQGHVPGDRGRVVKVPENPAGGDPGFYLVAMDKAGSDGMTAVFAEGEIEADV